MSFDLPDWNFEDTEGPSFELMDKEMPPVLWLVH